MLSWDCRRYLDQLFDADIGDLNMKILVCTFWRLLEAFISTMPSDVLLVGPLPCSVGKSLLPYFWFNYTNTLYFQDADEVWFSRLQDLFVFFASANLNHVFKEHRQFLVSKCKVSPVHFLTRLFTEEGAYFCFFYL